MSSAQRPLAKTVVYGADGHIKVVLATIEAKRGNIVYGYPVLGKRDQLTQLRAEDVTDASVVIGGNFKRAELVWLLVQCYFKLVTMIHPTATGLRGTRFGARTVILPYANIGRMSLLATVLA